MEKDMFSDFCFVPLSLSYDPKREGHPFKVKWITEILGWCLNAISQKIVSHSNIFFFNMSYYFNISLYMSVAFSHKNSPDQNIHQSNAWYFSSFFINRQVKTLKRESLPRSNSAIKSWPRRLEFNFHFMVPLSSNHSTITLIETLNLPQLLL